VARAARQPHMTPRDRLRASEARVLRLAHDAVPALITGGAGDDPAGVVTYTIVGATTGFSQLWLLALSTPMLAAALLNAANTSTRASAARSGRSDNSPTEARCGSPASSSTGVARTMPTLSCGHAATQSRQNVQSRLPRFAGRNRSSSQPRRVALPRIQSWVAQLRQVPASRTATVSGDASEGMK